MAEPFDNSTEKPSSPSSLPTGEGIVIDIGTGDGLFVYRLAQRNPKKFFIGVDASPRPLEKISEKIHRSPRKGGLPNVLFLQASVEELPSELDGVADEVHIHFPWGSLLRCVAAGDEKILRSLRRVCAQDALLEIIIGLDAARDRAEIERLGLRPLSIEFIDADLRGRYRNAGFEIMERGALPPSQWPRLETSWAKRLSGNESREVIYIIARASYE
ncbi:MAG: class I SAM-dependent methyltransferase [Acidobacteriota bacterium]